MSVQLAQRLASTRRSTESTLSLSEFHRLESPGNSERVEPRILARSILPFTRTALAPALIGLRFEELHRTITLLPASGGATRTQRSKPGASPRRPPENARTAAAGGEALPAPLGEKTDSGQATSRVPSLVGNRAPP